MTMHLKTFTDFINEAVMPDPKKIEDMVKDMPPQELYVLSYNVKPEKNEEFEEGLEKLIKKIIPNVSPQGLSRVLRNSSEHQENLSSAMDKAYNVIIDAVRPFLINMATMASKF